MTFSEFMCRRFGSQWVVARRSPRLIAKGYTVFFSPKEFAAWRKYAAAMGCEV